MTASSRDFGALSALRFTQPGSDFVGVADTGFWFFGTVARDAAGVPTGMSGVRMVQMVDRQGQPIFRKWLVDAEGLDVRDGIATVGFEREHRVAQFRIDPADMKAPFKRLDFLIPKNELRQNRGFETVTRAPSARAARGRARRGLRKEPGQGRQHLCRDHRGARARASSRSSAAAISTSPTAPSCPTATCFCSNAATGSADGVKMRLRRIYGESIAKGSVADGPVLFEADMSYQIDNMEGMDVWTRADGATMVSLISDDNHSILQRNLYLEFVLHDE